MMKRKLKELIQLIEDHFDREVWYSKPPLKEIDYQLALLSLKMGSIRKNITTGTITDINKEIIDLKEYIQQVFNIPSNEEELCSWLKIDEIRHKIVLNIYKRL